MSMAPSTLPAWLPPETNSQSLASHQPSWAARRPPRRSRAAGRRRRRSPSSRPRLAVVAVVRGGPLVDLAVGADSDLHPLPVVAVIAGAAGDRHVPECRASRRNRSSTGGRGCRPGRPSSRRPPPRPPGGAGAAVDDVDEGDHRLAGVAADDHALLGPVGAGAAATAAEVDRAGPRPSRRPCGHVLADQLRPPRSRRRRPAPARRRSSPPAPPHRGSARRPPAPARSPAPARRPRRSRPAAGRRREAARPTPPSPAPAPRPTCLPSGTLWRGPKRAAPPLSRGGGVGSGREEDGEARRREPPVRPQGADE